MARLYVVRRVYRAPQVCLTYDHAASAGRRCDAAAGDAARAAAAMIQSLFVLNGTGEVIIEKHWRGLRGRDSTLTFWRAVRAALVPADVPPFLPAGDGVLAHTARGGLFFLASVGGDTPPLAASDFLSGLADTLLSYFGELDEHAIKDNFITVYELLDEMLDEGYPMTVEQNILRALVPPPTVLGKVMTSVTGESGSAPGSRLHFPTASPSTPWRRNNVKHAQNEIFVDVVETVDAIFAAPRHSTHSSAPYAPRLAHALIRGEVRLNTRLSDVPDVSMTLRSVPPLADTALHRCVRSSTFADSGVLSFIPPDGPCTLMSYTMRDRANIPLPVELDAAIDFTPADAAGVVALTLRPRFVAPPSPYAARPPALASATSVAASMGTASGRASLSHATNTPMAAGSGLGGGAAQTGAAAFAAAAQSSGSMMLSQVMAAGGRMTAAGGAGAGVRAGDALMEDVEVSIPFGRAVSSVSLSANVGAVEFDSTTGTATWIVGTVARGFTPTLNGTVTLAAGPLGAGATRPSVLAKFRIPGYAASGMYVDRLDLGNSVNYKYFKGLRCMTKGERYELRPQ